MGRAGEEVADVFITGQRGHGSAVSHIRPVFCVDLVKAVPFVALQVRIVGALPDGAATLDGGLGLFGAGVERRERNGLDQGEFRCGFWSHCGFPLDIVFSIGG